MNPNNLQEKGLEFIQKYSAKIIGLLILGVIVSLIVSISGTDGKDRPSKTKDFAKTSVMIVDAQLRSGGTGVVLRSNKISSEILTNKHVCRLVQTGGFVIQGGNRYLVDSYKKYSKHDLCLVKIQKSLGVNTKVSDMPPTDFEDALISGHPALLPHVLTRGDFSGKQIIQLMVGLKECTKEDARGPYGMYCFFMGGMPVLESFESQLVTGTILPGSSGSGVFNAKGEISGLVFAGNGNGLGYAFIVPHEYLVDFLSTESLTPYTDARTAQPDKMIYEIFEKQKNCDPNNKNNKLYKNFCSVIEQYLIWEIKNAN